MTDDESTAPAQVRPVLPADLPALTRIYAHYVEDTAVTFETEVPGRSAWEQLTADVREQGWPFLVATEPGAPPGEGVLGYAYVKQWRPRPAYRATVEDSVYVAPEARGRGVGRVLLQALLAEAARRGARQVVSVITDVGDDASVRLHERLDFRWVGRLQAVGHKHDQWWDTVILQASLPEPG